MAGVYISYPFCRQKCTFCNFASGVAGPNTVSGYERALLTELRAQNWPWRPETVYLGGGTPSLTPPDFLSEVIDAVPGRPWAETTLECAPGTVTPERAANWRASGINRISLGVQSFLTAELRQTGRTHTAKLVESEVADATRSRSGEHQRRFDRRLAGSNCRILGTIPRLGRSPRPPACFGLYL